MQLGHANESLHELRTTFMPEKAATISRGLPLIKRIAIGFGGEYGGEGPDDYSFVFKREKDAEEFRAELEKEIADVDLEGETGEPSRFFFVYVPKDQADRYAPSEVREAVAGGEKARTYYLGGGSHVVQVPKDLGARLQAENPRSFRKGRTEGPVMSFYTTERGRRIAEKWLKDQGITVHGSPMWELEPGEHPSW